jgi:hypothetical protein
LRLPIRGSARQRGDSDVVDASESRLWRALVEVARFVVDFGLVGLGHEQNQLHRLCDSPGSWGAALLISPSGHAATLGCVRCSVALGTLELGAVSSVTPCAERPLARAGVHLR